MVCSSLIVLAFAMKAIASPLSSSELTATTIPPEVLPQRTLAPTPKMGFELRDLAITTTLGVKCTVTKVVGSPVQGDLTLTKYPYTITTTAATECHGCKLSVITRSVITFEPVKYTKTVTAPDPTTEYNWVCLPTGLAA
ncbi:hypothetical protein J7T55_012847 [Diaporthe amygdali]|nr:uncharacterized protein J7T55_012847 [Diaporthe amygdali]KAJ0118595.1 hypothetical protein J7T55_012847 [Diaporthe amygdali]